MTRCVECNEEFDLRRDFDSLEEAIGYTRDRPRGTGGLHHLRFWRKTGQGICGPCVRKKASNVSVFQESML